MKIKLIKFLDYIIGKPLCFFFSFFSDKSDQNKLIGKILIIRPGGIGDAVLLSPSLKILNSTIKNAQIDILAEKRNAGIFKNCNYIKSLYLYDDLGSFDLFKVLKNKYDVVIDTEQWHRLTAVVGFLTRAPVRIGFGTNEREKLFTKSVNYSQDDYEAISFINLISEITGKNHKFNKNEAFLDFESVSEKLDYFQYRKRKKTVIGIFSGATVKERKWSAEKYSLVADRLLNNNIGVVLLGGKSDLRDSQYFERVLGNRGYLNLIGKTSLEETKNIISDLDLLLSADSGLMHIAYGVGTKTVSLFGAGIQKKWAPPGINNRVINKEPSCSPCTKFGYTPSCPYNVRCLNDINVEEVYKKVTESLSN